MISGSKQRDDIRADGKSKAFEHLLRNCGTSDDVPPFEDEHPPTGGAQIGGRASGRYGHRR
jgi:hypothetical protein